MSQYCVGGTLLADSSTYVEREADRELYQALNNGEYCYILSRAANGQIQFDGENNRTVEDKRVCLYCN